MCKKIAMLFPYAPKYREPIYQLMDKDLDVDWFFCGNAERPLKLFDYQLLKRCDLSMQEKSIGGHISYYRGVNRLRLNQYDVVIIAGVIRNISEWVIPFKYRSENTKLFCWTHGWYGKESSFQRVIKRFYFKHFDGMFVYGDYAKGLLTNQGFSNDNVYVIKNSLDYTKQLELRNQLKPSEIFVNHFSNKYPVIIFIGRLTSVKRLDLLVEQISELKNIGEKYNLVFVGDGPEKDNLEMTVKQRGLESQVWFYGACYDEKTNAELIYNADLCVAPGNIGLTAIHSLMFGCPAMSHNDYKWQMPELEAIHIGTTGDFFLKDDLKDMTNAISSWFKNKKDREEIRQACYQEIDSYWNPEYQLKVLKQALKID